jgi:hypothetical protein
MRVAHDKKKAVLERLKPEFPIWLGLEPRSGGVSSASAKCCDKGYRSINGGSALPVAGVRSLAATSLTFQVP